MCADIGTVLYDVLTLSLYTVLFTGSACQTAQ